MRPQQPFSCKSKHTCTHSSAAYCSWSLQSCAVPSSTESFIVFAAASAAAARAATPAHPGTSRHTTDGTVGRVVLHKSTPKGGTLQHGSCGTSHSKSFKSSHAPPGVAHTKEALGPSACAHIHAQHRLRCNRACPYQCMILCGPEPSAAECRHWGTPEQHHSLVYLGREAVPNTSLLQLLLLLLAIMLKQQ